MSTSEAAARAAALLAPVEEVYAHVLLEGGLRRAQWPDRFEREIADSVANLACYLALRTRDLTSLQDGLAPLGLSTLGRSESRVLPSLEAVISALRVISGKGEASFPSADQFWYGDHRLDLEAEQLFGTQPTDRRARIMVTLSADMARHDQPVRDLMLAGMNVARINCAHDDAGTWERMIRNVRQAEATTGHRCLVAMDLCGPRARIESVSAPANHRVSFGELVLLTPGPPLYHPDFPVQLQSGIPEVVEQLEPGAPVWIDGGAIGAVVTGRIPAGLVMRIEQAGRSGKKLVAGKGLNFPGSSITISPLTHQDLRTLDFVCQHADLVGYSFVQVPGDIRTLFSEIERRGRALDSIGIILKVETPTAIQNLPDLIVASADRAPTAVMIARGDLAIEVGFGRMAEMQEELLWLCEAAHVPVVWATDVLANVAKKGTWTRAEVTDAAMAERADCVMLNKGPFIVDAVRGLVDVITRMEGHQSRKRPKMRRLKAWEPF